MPVNSFIFKNPPKEIELIDDVPFQLDQDLIFYHNRNTFRKHLVKLQNLFKTYTKNPLIASGIRDTYLDIEYFVAPITFFFTKENDHDIVELC